MKKRIGGMLFVVFFIILCTCTPYVTIDTSIFQLFAKQNNSYQNFAKFHKIFGTDEFLVIAVTTKKKDILNAKDLALINTITTTFEKNTYIETVVSITNIQDFAVKKVPLIEKYIPYPTGYMIPKAYEKTNYAVRKRVFSDPFLQTGLITKDRKTSFIWLLLKPHLKQDKDFSSHIKSITSDIPTQVRFSGFPIIYTTMKELILADAKRLFAFSFVISVLLLLLFRVPFVAILGFLLSLLGTAALWILYMAVSGSGLHVFSNIVPLFFFITSIPTIIHMNHSSSQHKITMHACFWSTITTSLGLFTLYFSSITSLSRLGIEIPLVMISSFVINVCFASPQKSPKTNKQYKVPSKYVWLCAVLLGFPWILFFLPLQTLPNFLKYLPSDHPVVQNFDYVSQKLKAQHPFEIVIEFNKNDAIFKSQTYFVMQKMQYEIAQEAIVAETISPVTLISSLNWKIEHDIQGNISSRNFTVTKRATEIAVSLFIRPFIHLFKKDGIFKYYRSQMKQLFSTTGKYTRIGCRLSSDDPQKIIALQNFLRTKIFPRYEKILQAKIYCSGYTLLIAHTTTDIYQTQQKSLFLGMIVIFVLFAIILHSVKLAVVAAFVNIMTIISVLSFLAMVKFPITLHTVILLAGLIGVMVDDTLHFLLHYNYYCKSSQNFDNRTALAKTLLHVKPAIFLSSFILICGFTAFFASKLFVYHHFAILFQVGIVLALFWDCYILPELLGRAINIPHY